MSYNFPEGGKFLFSNTFAGAKILATLSNANPAAAGSVAHGYLDNDEVVLTSGWEDATDSVFRVDQTSVDAFNILGLDTSDTNLFTAGGGANSQAKKISNWIEVPQVLTIGTSGGDARFAQVNPVFRRNGISRPLGFNPTTIMLTLAHDASNASYQTMLGISRVLSLVAFKLLLADGSASYGFGYMAVSEVPSVSAGNPNSVTAVFSAQGRTISY
ncbi:phage tail tube protein [Roseateles cavernae]|uniref:phage tail tube protein n=1 Tax=Roseateles cavernae TaxID=3153578 RepID=UPI0032E39AD3